MTSSLVLQNVKIELFSHTPRVLVIRWSGIPSSTADMTEPFEEVRDKDHVVLSHIRDGQDDIQLIPNSEGGDDVISNQVPACQPCNSSKGSRDVIEWYQERDTSIPRLVWGKYLKLMHDTYKQEGKLEEPLPEDERDKWSGLYVDRSRD